MWHKPCRTFHPWCLCIKTRCLYHFCVHVTMRQWFPYIMARWGCSVHTNELDYAQGQSSIIIFIRPSLDHIMVWRCPSVRPSVRSSVRPTVSTKKHRCKWRIFFKFCTQVCLGVPSINLLFVLSYLIKYAHNSIISDFSIFGIHWVIF